MTKSKITKFDAKKPFQGTTSAFVTFEDEKWGFFEYKGTAPFKEGDEVEYIATPEKTKGGKDIFKLTISLVPQGATSTSASVPAKEIRTPDVSKVLSANGFSDMKFQGRLECIKLAVSCFLAGKIDLTDVKTHFVEWYTAFDTSIDEIKE